MNWLKAALTGRSPRVTGVKKRRGSFSLRYYIPSSLHTDLILRFFRILLWRFLRENSLIGETERFPRDLSQEIARIIIDSCVSIYRHTYLLPNAGLKYCSIERRPLGKG